MIGEIEGRGEKRCPPWKKEMTEKTCYISEGQGPLNIHERVSLTHSGRGSGDLEQLIILAESADEH